MSKIRVLVQAPANIALIKYMGKRNETLNIPENPSLSFTLKDLSTRVEFECDLDRDGAGFWLNWNLEPPVFPSSRSGYPMRWRVPSLDLEGKERVRRHLLRVFEESPPILRRFGIKVRKDFKVGQCRLHTANSFPESAGIASSASSFAAVTLAAAMVFARDAGEFERKWRNEPELRRALARVSRRGSGSSCRSFEGSWVLWEEEEPRCIETSALGLSHLVILVSTERKMIASSLAHQHVKSSPLWAGRVERATGRCKRINEAIKDRDLAAISRISWLETWEMHSLFHTSATPFSYWKPLTIDILNWLSHFVSDGPGLPIVTMDAGPNIHLLVPDAECCEWERRVTEHFPGVHLLRDQLGEGALPLERWYL